MGAKFFQDGPEVQNTYDFDAALKSFLQWRLPKKVLDETQKDLHRLGNRMATDVLAMSRQAEAQEPEHVPYGPWGERVDEIKMSPAWTELDRVAAEEGMVATGYERKFAEFSRVVQFAKLYLFHPSSAFYTCPLAMTDGAARAIELYGDSDLKNGAFKNLTSRKPGQFWTAGQWMTERVGGSDVSDTETIAKPLGGDRYALFGHKWFTSASTAQMALTLARIEGAEAGNRGLSMFYVELRDEKGRLKNIQLNRLKDKLGTRAMPTAELDLNGTPAKLVGEPGTGVRKIATVLNITRLYNSICAVGSMARGVQLLKDYSQRRKTFGTFLREHPLHNETLASLQVETQVGLFLTLDVALLLGKEECGSAAEDEKNLLRLLTPVVKLLTGKQAVWAATETLEGFGGAGYIEDTDLPRLLRDNQVFPIWEGTTNVLSLDVLRVLVKTSAFEVFVKNVGQRLEKLKGSNLEPSRKRILEEFGELVGFSKKAASLDPVTLQAIAREFSLSLGRIYGALLLAEHASFTGDASVLNRFCLQKLWTVVLADEKHREETLKILDWK